MQISLSCAASEPTRQVSKSPISRVTEYSCIEHYRSRLLSAQILSVAGTSLPEA
jgi:hypothetical protein